MRKPPGPLTLAAPLLFAGMLLWLAFSGAAVEVRIPEGASGREVAALLEREGVLRFTVGFRILAQLSGMDRSLKPGTYRLRHNMASLEAIWRLNQGGADFIKVTIPEGWRLEQVADRLEEAGVTPGSAFAAFAKAQQWEGFLFPTTYHLKRGMAPESVARLMREEFDRQVLSVYRASGRSLDLDKVVTLASIIEREAILDAEKPVIASVYFNRFARSMRLEADPTVQYGLGRWKKGLTLKDLEVDSPYNTYRHTGMPPAPICSPGLASIKAALFPERTQYLYFVADYKGAHTFHRTHADFLKAKAEAKKELRRQKDELRRQKSTAARK